MLHIHPLTVELVSNDLAVVRAGPRGLRLGFEPAGLEALAALLVPPLPDADDLTALLAGAGVELLPAWWRSRR